MPDEIVASLGLSKRLEPLTRPSLASIPLQAVYRTPLGAPDLVAALAAHLADPSHELVVPAD